MPPNSIPRDFGMAAYNGHYLSKYSHNSNVRPLKAASANGRKGSNREDAIVLDDEDSEAHDFVILSNYQPRAKATPPPTLTASIKVPCDDDVLIYGEEFNRSVQRLTEPVGRHDRDQRTIEILALPKQNHEETFAWNNHKNGGYENDYRPPSSRAPIALMYSPSNGRVPNSRTNARVLSPKTQTLNDQQAPEYSPSPAKAAAIPEQKADYTPSVAPQFAEQVPTKLPITGNKSNLKKSGTLAERMELPKLPVITKNHGQPMGFAAIPSAKNNMHKLDPPQPIFDILKPNRKRPLSKMGINELYTPGQVISDLAFEANRRQRLKKKVDRASENSGGIQELKSEWGLSPVDQENGVGNDSEYANESRVIEQMLNEKVGSKPDKIYNTQANSEQEVAYVEELEPFVPQPIDGEQPAITGEKKICFEEPAPSSRKPAPTKQATLNSELQYKQPAASQEPSMRPQEQTPAARSMIAGKGISDVTLPVWQAADAESYTHTTPYHSVVEQEDNLVTVTESVYEYHVHRHEWLTEDPEGEVNAEEQILGPYYTLQEANAVAMREVHHPIQLSPLHGIRSRAWDHSFRQDHDGLQTQCAEAVGIHIEAEVKRELAAPDNRRTFPASAFRVTSCVYLVQELSWSPASIITLTPTATPSVPAPPLCQTITHSCCTTLDRANKKAAEQWLAAYTGAWSDFRAEGKRKDQVERELKFDLKEMKEGRECFEREVVFENGAMCKIWVVECKVEGPRN